MNKWQLLSVISFISQQTQSFKSLSLLCSPRLHLFDLEYSKNSNIVKYYYNLKQQFFFYFHTFKKNYADLMLKEHLLLFIIFLWKKQHLFEINFKRVYF